MSIKPIVLKETPAPPDVERDDVSRGHDQVVFAQRLVFVVVCSMAAVVSLIAAYQLYLLHLASDMKPVQVYVETEFGPVYLVQPTAVVTPFAVLAPDATPLAADVDESPESAPHSAPTSAAMPPLATVAANARAVAPTPRADVPLPPTGLVAPSIGIDVPVRMVTTDTLPREPYAGWFFRSAFPATAGNVVILGHVDGVAAVFSRLGELKPGDEVTVSTATHQHIYVVEWTAFVDASAVEMLGPNSDPILTLITCAGEWDPEAREYESRIVVRAKYAKVEQVARSR